MSTSTKANLHYPGALRIQIPISPDRFDGTQPQPYARSGLEPHRTGAGVMSLVQAAFKAGNLPGRGFAALISAITLWLAAVAPVAMFARAGLYDDDEKVATKGDLNNQDYWWAKYDNMMLELALKLRQPEGRIDLQLASSVKRLEELEKKFPKHTEIKKWKERAQEIQAKIDPNANRSTPFSPECPWEESNFAQLWVNLQHARMQFDNKEYTDARALLQNVMQNYEIMLKPDRMKHYPEELRKWVIEHKPDAEKLKKQIQEKMH